HPASIGALPLHSCPTNNWASMTALGIYAIIDLSPLGACRIGVESAAPHLPRAPSRGRAPVRLLDAGEAWTHPRTCCWQFCTCRQTGKKLEPKLGLDMPFGSLSSD